MTTAMELVAAAKQQCRCLTAEEAADRVGRGEVLLLDIREPDEHAAGAVAGAVHVPRGVLEFRIGEICDDRDQEILLHCGGGGRASLAAESLKQLGYGNVSIVDAEFQDLLACCRDSETG